MKELSLIYVLKLPNAFHEKSCFLLFPIFLSFNHLMWKFLCFLPVSGSAICENKPEKLSSSSSKPERDSHIKCIMFLLFFKILFGWWVVGRGRGKQNYIKYQRDLKTWPFTNVHMQHLCHPANWWNSYFSYGNIYYMEIDFIQKLFM